MVGVISHLVAMLVSLCLRVCVSCCVLAPLHVDPRFYFGLVSSHIVDPTTSSSGMGQDVALLRCKCFFVGAGDVFGRVSRSARSNIQDDLLLLFTF